MKSKLRVAMIAPPWLSIPPNGYGGIEEVLYGLIPELKNLGVEVELFSIGKSHINGIKTRWLYQDEQYKHIYKPLYESSPIAIAQMLFALEEIKRDGKFDIIHDHNGFVGPLALHWATRSPNMPPALHTYHGPPFDPKKIPRPDMPDSRLMWQQLIKTKRLFLTGVSESLMQGVPEKLRPQILPAVHNAVTIANFPFQTKKQKHFITIGRFSSEKGQHLASQICDELGYGYLMAGTIAGITNPRQLLLELANPLSKYRGYADFCYYSDNIWPIMVKNPRIRYVGNVSKNRKMRFLANAKAMLFPIDWEEPFGMVVIEAMACGTPVIAMKRGAMPEIIEHGVNGFLANSAKEFRDYMQRINEIDPSACRRTVEQKFSTRTMAQRYLAHYQTIIKRTAK